MHLSIEHNDTVEIKEKRACSTLKKQSVKARKKSTIVCEICCKTFSGMQSMKSHVESIHEGKKPFKCNICEKGFTKKVTLNGHIESFHQQNNPLK